MIVRQNQHRIASGIVALISLWIGYISFTQIPAEAYTFPRILSVILVVSAVFTFIKALRGKSKVGDGLSRDMCINMLPGLLISVVYFFWAAKTIGFYTATTLAVFAILSVYDPKPNNQSMTWVRRTIITAMYIAILYTLFALVLKVFTPQGMFI